MFKEFLNVANEEKFTVLRGKLFQTFTTRSLKKVYPCVRAAVLPARRYASDGTSCDPVSSG